MTMYTIYYVEDCWGEYHRFTDFLDAVAFAWYHGSIRIYYVFFGPIKIRTSRTYL